MSLRLPPEWERWRVGTPPTTAGTSGTFGIPHVWQSSYRVMTIILSDGPAWAATLSGEPWEHASVALPDRCPTWAEMEWVRRQLWPAEDTVMQLHPPLDQYVNANEYALHLWRPTRTAIPMPLEPATAHLLRAQATLDRRTA